MNNDIIQFKNSIKKNKESRFHKITNSFGVYDSYKWIRKNKWLNIGRPVTEHEFYSIIRTMNKELTKNEINYIIDIIMTWIKRHM